MNKEDLENVDFQVRTQPAMPREDLILNQIWNQMGFQVWVQVMDRIARQVKNQVEDLYFYWSTINE